MDDADRRSLPSHAPADHAERLWTPWRMRYVGGGAKEGGCIFCNRLGAADDVSSLILWRAPRSFVIMNLFPYNTGHVMLVPNAHVPGPEEADPETLAEMATMRGPTLRALRRALSCDGFNLGVNVGAFAGAGVTDHLHEHVVPRWAGDANFMPILAATMVLPELIPVTYAKLRSELGREMGEVSTVTLAILNDTGDGVLLGRDGRLPVAEARHGQPLWRAGADSVLAAVGSPPSLLGWAGGSRAEGGTPALGFGVQDPGAGAGTWSAPDQLPPDEAGIVDRARRLREPSHQD